MAIGKKEIKTLKIKNRLTKLEEEVSDIRGRGISRAFKIGTRYAILHSPAYTRAEEKRLAHINKERRKLREMA